MSTIEIDKDLAIKACEMYNYNYSVITPNDIVIPPAKMITFQKIRWKNFLSTGDQWTEIDLNKSSTTLVIGTNGAGKSTMLDALCFALFNKPYRKINKPQLVNSSNEKGCLVEVEFSVGPRNYLIRRGIKPNVFDIIVDGEMKNKEADDRANQKDCRRTDPQTKL